MPATMAARLLERATLVLLSTLVIGAAAMQPAATTDINTPSAPAAAELSDSPLRIWIDEFFFSDGETVLLREAVEASGGAAVVAGTTRNRVLQLKSYQQTSKADVMWTGRQGCYEAFKRRLNASHAISCVPGTQAVSDKARLVASLEAAYGEAAWGIVPRSYRLPQQYAQLAAHLKQEEQGSSPGGLWVLKEDVHRGKGVAVATPAQVLQRGLERAPGRPGAGHDGGPRHVMAQQFLREQYLVQGRPFYIRVWAVLAGADPARAYLYNGGVVVFGQQQDQEQAGHVEGGEEGQQQQQQQQQGRQSKEAADALIVNLWTQDRKAAAPWSLQQLEEHVASTAGRSAAARLRRRLHTAAAASLASALPSVRRSARALPGFQGGSFEVLGLDYLVDGSLRPWLVEVNFLPSMARKLVGCAAAPQKSGDTGGSSSSSSSSSSSEGSGSSQAAGCQRDNPFDVQKEGFIRGLLGLLMHRHRQLAPAEHQAQAVLQAASEAATEGQGPPCMDAAQLRELLALPAEEAAAKQLGFVPLTGQLYRSLGCMTARPVNGSAAGSDGACAVLAELAVPAAPEQQQCSALSSGTARLLARLQKWARLAQLEGVALLARLSHPRVAWRLWKAGKAGAAVVPPYPLRDSDRRMLAWMERGSPLLDSAEAAYQFCDAAA